MKKKNTSLDKTRLDELLISPKTLASLHYLPLQDRIQIVQAGISKVHLTEIKNMLNFDYDLLSRLLLITNRSMHLKKGNDLFSVSVSDRIMAILELYSFGYEVMGGYADFHEWMKRPSEKLLSNCPINMIVTHPGLLAVRAALTSIQLGHL
jgi:putative toxin-antitoxin system antitoxin component (TIGR02293 family)